MSESRTVSIHYMPPLAAILENIKVPPNSDAILYSMTSFRIKLNMGSREISDDERCDFRKKMAAENPSGNSSSRINTTGNQSLAVLHDIKWPRVAYFNIPKKGNVVWLRETNVRVFSVTSIFGTMNRVSINKVLPHIFE